MAVKRIVAPRQAAVLALAAPAHADATGKRIILVTRQAAGSRFARGTAVEVRHRLARAPRSGRWMVVFVRATVVDSAVSGANDDCYVVRYPACTTATRRMACVPVSDVREARRTPTSAAAKRPSPESSTDGASCKKAKRTGQGIPMDALLRYVEEVKALYPDAEFELPQAPTNRDPGTTYGLCSSSSSEF